MEPEKQYLPCSKRQRSVLYKKDGAKERIYKCTEATSEKAFLTVIQTDCAACSVRQAVLDRPESRALRATQSSLGVIVTRAPEYEGPGYIPCLDRERGDIPGCCGNVRGYVRICTSKDSVQYEKEVMPVTCSSCPVRRIKVRP